ncbi:MAG: hypothetical protein JW744_02400 [Candidatus Diapherotrites archaeon]|uniref:Uncharacterized protein n=1 Tax=Candidatus Iainarchaeum sp. TaxID=3101447 RepID=A0A939C6C5_9ARCH|nr:hypothetical protein [Candidatus Diapherotrites archaeon]
MPLGHLVAAAKQNTPQINPRKVLMNFVDADLAKPKVEKREEIDWRQCKHVKNINGKATCSQYMSFCAMEKCKQNYMQSDFFSYKKHLKKAEKDFTSRAPEQGKEQ